METLILDSVVIDVVDFISGGLSFSADALCVQGDSDLTPLQRVGDFRYCGLMEDVDFITGGLTYFCQGIEHAFLSAMHFFY